MIDPRDLSGADAPLRPADGTVTLVEGSAFCISGPSGNLLSGGAHGLFFRDTRFLSGFEVRVNGGLPERLTAAVTDPFSAVFVGRMGPTLLVIRHRYVGRGMREDLTVRNYADEPAFCSIELAFAADFADLFEVKAGRRREGSENSVEQVGGHLVFRHRRGARRRSTQITLIPPALLRESEAVYEIIVPAQGEWRGCVEVAPVIDAEVVEPRWRCGQPVERAAPAERMTQWRRRVPLVDTDHSGLRTVVRRSAEDLGALRIFDPDYPERAIVAAGAPWFMTLFGRDSLLTSWMALLVDPDLALGVLQTLARFQGDKEDPRYDEQPGRILHEMRFSEAPSLSLGGGKVYFGSADATPLFVMLLGELRRWGLAREAVDELLPAADKALTWIEEYGDRDGDGYVEYQRATDRGLVNQGWKDSAEGVRFADGELARAPIALCEVQGYVYAAYLARAHFADEAGDASGAERYAARAADLKARFNRDYWLEKHGWLAMGLDHDKRPIDALTSNMGHCLWTGILDEDKAAAVAERLLSPDMFSGWGVRTLARSMSGYNPISYHCGSVWPHDNAIVAAGLMRYGYVEEAQRITLAMLDAAMSQGGRLPELFTGLDRGELPVVVGYPTSCSPQAWAAASPFLLLRTLLRLDPQIPRGKVFLAPVLPEGMTRLRVERIPLAGRRVTVDVVGDQVQIEGMPDDLQVITEPRRPMTAV